MEMDKVVMPQVEEVLRRVDKGEELKQIVREERRKVKRELERKNQKPLKFGKQDIEETEKKTKRKAENDVGVSVMEGLTQEEKMAVELYQVIKKSRNNKDLEDDEDELDDIGLDTREDEPEDD